MTKTISLFKRCSSFSFSKLESALIDEIRTCEELNIWRRVTNGNPWTAKLLHFCEKWWDRISRLENLASPRSRENWDVTRRPRSDERNRTCSMNWQKRKKSSTIVAKIWNSNFEWANCIGSMTTKPPENTTFEKRQPWHHFAVLYFLYSSRKSRLNLYCFI